MQHILFLEGAFGKGAGRVDGEGRDGEKEGERKT